LLRPNQAPLVRELTDADIDALYDLRGLLELHAFDLAWPAFTTDAVAELVAVAGEVELGKPGSAKRCLAFDRAFHEFWLARCGNPWLERDLRRHYQFLRIFQRWAGQDEDGLRQAYREHQAVLTAIRRGDRRTAREALREHIAASAAIVKAARARTGKHS
jgi:DNA-binding GntR family transcriptional regulator